MTDLPKAYLDRLSQKARPTQDKYLVYLRRFVAEVPDWRLAESADVRGWLDRVGEDHSPATWNLALSSLKHLYNWAIGERIVLVDPTRTLAAQRYKPHREFLLSANDVAKVISWVLDHGDNSPMAARNCALVILLASTAMRISQAVALNWNALILGPRSRVIVPPAKGSVTNKIGLVNLARDALLHWRNVREEAGWRLDSPAVFVGQGTDRLTSAAGRKAVQGVLSACGYRGRHVGPHLFRHAFVTAWGLERPGDILGCAEITGHENPEMLSRYFDLHFDEQRKLIGGLSYLRGHRVP